MLAVQIGERVISTDRVPVNILWILEEIAKGVNNIQFGKSPSLQVDFHIFLDILESARIDDEWRIFWSSSRIMNGTEFELRIVSTREIQFLNSDGEWEALAQSRDNIDAIKIKLWIE